VRDFNRQTGWKMPAESGDTLAGLVFNTLGRTPRRGESILMPGYEIVVTDLSRNASRTCRSSNARTPPSWRKKRETPGLRAARPLFRRTRHCRFGRK
jgi:Mg2+/Co2+ transporter CorC